MLENGIYIFGKHPLLLKRIQVSDLGPIGPLVFVSFYLTFVDKLLFSAALNVPLANK